MKYLLIEVQEREISTPAFFNSHEAAHNEMCKRFAEVLGVSVADIEEACLGNEFDSDACVLEDSAWAERHGNNYDWSIFSYEEDGQCVS